MLVIPALTLKNGFCVIASQGGDEKIFSREAVNLVRMYVMDGAKLVHITDLDAVQSPKRDNLDIISSMTNGTGLLIQYGGRIDSFNRIKKLIDMGVHRVVIGTAAFENPLLIKKTLEQFADKIVISLSIQNGKLFGRGFKQQAPVQLKDFIQTMKRYGVQTFQLIDLSRQGTSRGVNTEFLDTYIPMIGSGVYLVSGISSIEDIESLVPYESLGLCGCVIGRAVHEGKIQLQPLYKKFPANL